MNKYLTVQEILDVTGGKLLYGNVEEQCKKLFKKYKRNKCWRHIYRIQG